MSSRARSPSPRPLGTLIGALALFFAVAAPSTAAWTVSLADGPNPQVGSSGRCAELGETGYLTDRTIINCAATSNSNAFAYYSEPLTNAPDTPDYNCDTTGCENPDGTIPPNEDRCGIQCTAPPAPGLIVPHLASRL